MEIIKTVWNGLSQISFNFFGLDINFVQIFCGFAVLSLALKFLYNLFSD